MLNRPAIILRQSVTDGKRYAFAYPFIGLRGAGGLPPDWQSRGHHPADATALTRERKQHGAAATPPASIGKPAAAGPGRAPRGPPGPQAQAPCCPRTGGPGAPLSGPNRARSPTEARSTGSPAEAHRQPLGPPPRRGGTQRGTRQPAERMPPPPEAAPAPRPGGWGTAPAMWALGGLRRPLSGPWEGPSRPGRCATARPLQGACPGCARRCAPLQGHQGGRLRRLPRRCSGARAPALAGPPYDGGPGVPSGPGPFRAGLHCQPPRKGGCPWPVLTYTAADGSPARGTRLWSLARRIKGRKRPCRSGASGPQTPRRAEPGFLDLRL